MMRIQEVRRRYAAHRPRRGETLLIARPGAGATAETEELHRSLWTAELAALAWLRAPGCDELWLYDGQRLYDARALRARILHPEVPSVMAALSLGGATIEAIVAIVAIEGVA